MSAGLTKKAVRDAVAIVNKNIEVIKQVRITASKGIQAVESSTEKVKAAMMW